jgi:hypothetical protein
MRGSMNALPCLSTVDKAAGTSVTNVAPVARNEGQEPVAPVAYGSRRYVPPFQLVSVVVVRCVCHAGVSGWALEDSLFMKTIQ